MEWRYICGLINDDGCNFDNDSAALTAFNLELLFKWLKGRGGTYWAYVGISSDSDDINQKLDELSGGYEFQFRIMGSTSIYYRGKYLRSRKDFVSVFNKFMKPAEEKTNDK